MRSISSSPGPSTSKPQDRSLPLQYTEDQWQELGNMMFLDGTGAMNSVSNDTRAAAVPQTSYVPTSSTNHIPDSGIFTGGINMPPKTLQSTPEATFNQTLQERSELAWNSLPSSSHSDLPDTQTRPIEVHWMIINKLTKLNSKVSHDLHDLKRANRAGGNDKNVLVVKTLQHLDMMLELLGIFTHPKQHQGPEESPDCSLPDLSSSGSTQCSHLGGITFGWGEKVDTDIALMLLSYTMNVRSLYKLLCTELTTQSIPHFETRAQSLLSLRLEGLQTLDAEMCVHALMLISSLKFIKIQKELELIPRLGLLTQTANEAFQVVLGNGGALSPGFPAFGVEQIMDQFRRDIIAKVGPSG
ncbi:hypothetical protein DL766_000908 [Monosporascus sp. MC13-8B]|uniref:Aflatoxin regulatory protein domain-containing protein n=1 Tax=Monosporascus cannonballus TaxID=155416 RepID=A0ABY0HAZ6_9PEZI|nr:hypothetical protein DL762_003294 [Monosporascus cannonballus]RYP00762.1 hypothetical protein DL763_000642 [Monosporascus cannonballus]RYP38491.1 hypothetical protein DL766_000908 [Monosporascus sp. MC13-8B]